MPNIKPISDLRNYTAVMKQIDASSRVYITRNGHGGYDILTMAEIDELDRCRVAYTLFSKLKKMKCSPDAREKLKQIKHYVTQKFGLIQLIRLSGK